MMNSRVATLSFCGNKNCFLKIPQSWASAISSDTVLPLKIVAENAAVIYASWQGEVSSQSYDHPSDVIEINALFASKHGFQDGTQVVVSAVSNVATCERAFVEPLSVDDWEVLELHAAYVESHILDQVRVVWKDQVLPLWVTSSICIFVKVESVDPEGECCMLEQFTELHIAPKDRNLLTRREKSERNTVSQRLGNAELKPAPQTGGEVEGAVPERTSQENEKNNNIKQIGILQWLMTLFHNLFFGSNPSLTSADTASSDQDTAMSFDFKPECLSLDRALISSLRIQPGPRLEERVDSFSITDLHPTCVFVSESSLGGIVDHPPVSTPDLYRLPHSFLIAMKASRSLAEREEIINKKALNKKPLGTKSSSAKQNNGKAADQLPEEASKEGEVVVRLVVLDAENKFKVRGSEGVRRVKLREQVLPSHMMVSDLLRRQLMLPVTGRVCLIPLLKENTPVLLTALNLHPLFNTPDGVTPEMMVTAFRKWICDVTSRANPLVVTNGTLIRLPLLSDFSGEFMLTLDHKKDEEKKTWPDYCLLYQQVCDIIKIHAGPKITNTDKPKTITNLPSWDLQEIDPKVPVITHAQLGGVDAVYRELLSHTRALLQSFPLSAHFMEKHHGLRGVLVCGPKGCGKSTITRAICRALAEQTPLAHITVIDCKPLRGKRVDSIQKQLHTTFEEAAWRQPSVILLDDLDQIAAAPTGPEQEISGEAVYFTRVAEVIKDLLHREMTENSSLVVMVTCKAQERLHVSLTASRGHHFFQKIVHMKPPDKVARQSILAVLLNQRAGVKPGHLEKLGLGGLAEKTEGYEARDLELLVNRAVHAHRMTSSQGHHKQQVTRDDLLQALDGFTPMGLRNVTLHSGGEVTWHDVGGLKDVKSTLVETLLWPAKYPKLFSNCPLRLRQGLLLYGAPGTGKTLLAGAVAKECGLNFISIKGPELLSKYIGASEQAVRQTFERAQSAKPCILFFDEFDSLAPRRGHDSTGVTDRVVNQLLTQLDGVEGLEGVYVLGATSRPDLIDPALLRPGRLDKALFCTLPTKEDREEILVALSRNMRLAEDVDLEAVADMTPHFTGADLKALLYNAQLASIHESTDLWGSVKDPTDILRLEQEMIISSSDNDPLPQAPPSSEAAPTSPQAPPTSPQSPPTHPNGSQSGEPSDKPPPGRTASFEYLLPDGASTSVNGGGRPRSSSSGGSSSSDHSVGQSPSWEVVAMVTEKARPEAVKRRRGERLAYMPNVEEGVVQLSQHQEDEVIAKVKENYITQENEETADVGEKSISLIYQRHLVCASKKMQPSVTERERQKYRKIYENFSRSKGGDFGGASGVAGQRATLA